MELGGVCPTLNAFDNATETRATVVVAFSSKDHGADAGDISPTLRAMPHDGSHSNGGGQVAVAVLGDNTHALTHEGHDASEDGTGRGTPIIALAWQAGGGADSSGAVNTDGMTPTLPKEQTLAVLPGTQVRRLIPLECERLQGFPDEWTEDQADSPRYKQMGNSLAVPVFQWVIARLVAVDSASVARSDA